MVSEAVWQGEYYSKHSHIQERWHQALMSSVTFRGDESILDIGCGDGRFTKHYSTLVPRGKVLGIDSSESMIAWAGHRHEGAANLNFRVQNALNFSCKREFDWIFSSNCLHWIPDHRRVIHRITRALNPNGRFILLFACNANPLHPILQATQETIISERWKSHFVGFGQMGYSFPYRYYERWAKEARISQFTLMEIDSDEIFENLEMFVAWMKGWLQPLKRLPFSLHDFFAEEVGFRYLQRSSIQDQEGDVHFPQKLCLLKGSL